MLTFLALGDINAAGPWTTFLSNIKSEIGSNLFTGETHEEGGEMGKRTEAETVRPR